MTDDILVQIFVKQEHLKAFEQAAGYHFFDMPEAQQCQDCTIFRCGRMTPRMLRETIEHMQDEEVPCTFLCTDSGDPTIQDYTVLIEELDGEFVTKETTRSGEREIVLTIDLLRKINSGQNINQLRTFLEEKMKSFR